MTEDHLINEADQAGSSGVPWGRVAFWGGILIALIVAVMAFSLIKAEGKLQKRVETLTTGMRHAERLTKAIVDLGKPGNDLLENDALEQERNNLDRYRAAFESERTLFTKMISEHGALSSHLQKLKEHVSKLKAETDAVFFAIASRDEGRRSGATETELRAFERQAASSMARMDRQNALALGVMMEIRGHFLDEQNEVAASMRVSFYVICFLTLIEFFSFAIGLYLLRRLGKSHNRALVLKKYIGNVLSNIPSGIIVLSEDLVVMSANRSFRQQFWTADAMLKGKSLDEALPMIDLKEEAREALLSQTASKEILVNISAEKSVQESGKISGRYFHLSLIPLDRPPFAEQGHLLLVARDITGIKKVELQTRLILTNAQDGVIVFKEQGEMTWANPAAERMFGKQQSDLKGQHLGSLLLAAREMGHEKLIKHVIRTTASKEPGKRRLYEGLRSNGAPFPMEIVVSRFREEGHWVFTAFLRDKTEEAMAEAELESVYAENKAAFETLKDQQQQLVQSEKMASIGQLAAGVAHEINNPVGFVKSNLGRMKEYSQDLTQLLVRYEGFLRGIERKEKTDIETEAAEIALMSDSIQADFIMEDLPVLLDESIDGIDRVREIVKNLKEFSHVDRGAKRPFNLNEGLESTLKIAWNELKYDTEVIKEYGDIPDVTCRPQQINQVFMNLLVNAAHAIKEKAKALAESSDKEYRADKGKILIRTYSEEGQVVAEIKDSGVGIAEEKIEKIFDPFYTTKPVGKGTGLGLSISYGIIKKHGGEIAVASEPGVGTTFRVILPENAPDLEKEREAAVTENKSDAVIQRS